MLKEFKKPMWNDGPAKQPWLNYFNEYELQHCCFGGDGGTDDAGAGDEAFSTSLGGKATQSTTSDISDANAPGMSADQAQEISDAIDAAEKAGASNTQMQNIAEGGNRAAQAGYTGAELGTVAAANIDVNFFDETDKGPGTRGVGSGSISGYGSFADPFSDSGVGQTSFKSFSEDLGGAISGAAGVVGEALQGMYSMTPSGLMMGMATGKGPGGDMVRSALGRDYDAPLSGLAGLFSSKRGDPEFEAFSKEVAAKNADYEKARQAAEEEKNMGNITNEEYMDIIDEINKSKSSITGPSGLEGFGGLTLEDYEEARQAAARADMEDYEGIGGPGSYSFEVGDPTYDPDRVDLGPMLSEDKAGISSITNANKNPNEIDEEGYYGILGDAIAREQVARAAENAKATESQRMEDIVMGPDLSRATPSLGGKDQTEAGRRGQISYDAFGVTPTTTRAKEKEKETSSTAVSDFLSSIAAALRGPTDPQAALAAISKRDREELDRVQRENRSMGGVVYRDGGGTTEPFEFSMADYFKNQKTAPFYSTKPNEYLVALQRQIYPDITTDEIYRRLGYRPAPDPDDTSSTTSYYNNPYGMNI